MANSNTPSFFEANRARGPRKCLSVQSFATLAKCRRNHRQRQSGVILLIVLVTVVVMTLAALTFMSLMQVEEQAVRVLARRVQSKYLADSGVDYTRLFLSAARQDIHEKGGLWDNPDQFQAIPAAIDLNNLEMTGRFSVVSPSMNDDGIPEGYRFGLVDESSKINLNSLPYFDNWTPGSARQILMSLPDMTEEIADSILDWVDEDDEEREFGTESGYYRGLAPAYVPKNGPLDSLDELLLVKGVTPELLFSLDTNRNGVLDTGEIAGTGASSLDADQYLGWANYITLFSKESNLNDEGLERVNINAEDLDQLYDDLKSAFNDEWTNFILQYRIHGPAAAPTEQDQEDGLVKSANLFPPDLGIAPEQDFRFASVVDLVDQWVSFEDSEGEKVYLQSPIALETIGLTLLTGMKQMTVYEGESIPGRINIMQAPRRVLEGIPGFDSELIDTILQVREFELDDPEFLDLNRNYETWLLTEFLVDVETMRSLMPYICVGGDVYSAEVVGYFGDGIGTSRAEAVIDITTEVPRILFWRDKTRLEGSFSVEILGGQLSN